MPILSGCFKENNFYAEFWWCTLPPLIERLANKSTLRPPSSPRSPTLTFAPFCVAQDVVDLPHVWQYLQGPFLGSVFAPEWSIGDNCTDEEQLFVNGQNKVRDQPTPSSLFLTRLTSTVVRSSIRDRPCCGRCCLC